MVEFGTGYYHPMDREYDSSGIDLPHHHRSEQKKIPATGDVGISMGDLGMSLGLGPVPNVAAVKSKLHPGTKTLEFVFMGAGKGTGQGHTPEFYGQKQRQALREIGAANRVDFTTHSTVGVQGLAGMDRGGNFSRVDKEMSLHEVKRAIEFAADVAQGGPVVVHTGEFHRPLADAEWNINQGDPFAHKFKMFEDEEGRASYRVVDRRTGGVIQEARKSKEISRPVWNIAKSGEEFLDFNGAKKIAKSNKDEKGILIYLDPFGNRVDSEHRVPEFDPEKQEFKVHQVSWEQLEEEAKDMTLRARDEWRKFNQGNISKSEFEKGKWARFSKSPSLEEVKIRPEEAYIIAAMETNAAQARGWALYYGGNFQEQVNDLKKLREAKQFYEQMERETDEKERWKLKRQYREVISGLIPPEEEFPSKIIEKRIKDIERSMKQSQEGAANQWAQAAEHMENIRHVESAETYALREASNSYAVAGINAMRQTNRLKEEGNYKKPLQIAMENLFPESYGSHPDELIKLVLDSRKEMVRLLVEQNKMPKEQAVRTAEQHITSTLDTGHLNMWRKYWQGDPNKTVKENDTEFDKWIIKKVEEMAQAKIIGHVHIDDNYGYHDDHLAPGEGNAPVREMIETLKKNGYKGELIVEPGADYSTDSSGFHSVMKTWRNFGLPVYGGGSGLSPRGRTWKDVGYGWFDQVTTPYFTFGAYVPSEDWTLWSGVQLE
ncbi:MAG TPA: TIM barrel protein [Candidatus Nanoarchaeia archaeon]|nr:TIM barrel protein [Candidatus Nanoarchaeia archaeon]